MFLRRGVALAAAPTIISLLDRVILLVGAKPKYLISDQEGRFFSAEMNDWRLPRGITQRFEFKRAAPAISCSAVVAGP